MELCNRLNGGTQNATKPVHAQKENEIVVPTEVKPNDLILKGNMSANVHKAIKQVCTVT